MKKHLRGKRYIRSRASVMIGRNKRLMKRIDAFAYFVKYRIPVIVDGVNDFIYNLGESFLRVAQEMSRSITESLSKSESE